MPGRDDAGTQQGSLHASRVCVGFSQKRVGSGEWGEWGNHDFTAPGSRATHPTESPHRWGEWGDRPGAASPRPPDARTQLGPVSQPPEAAESHSPHCPTVPKHIPPPGTEHTHTSAVCGPLSLRGSSRRVGQVGQEQKRKVKVKRKSFGKPSASLLALPHSFAPPGSSRWVSGARQPTLFGCASAESSLRSATLARRFRAGSRLATAPAAEKAGSPRAVATSSCDAALQSEELQRLAA